MGPDSAVAQVRAAIRRSLDDLPPGALILAACSGGADSLALAAGLAHEAPRRGLRAGGVTVDHGLQPGSSARADAVADLLTRLGLDPVESASVSVPAAGHGGPEAAARAARYAALDAVAARAGASAVLLGHSLDDQAEAVLLGLARGSGARSLAGMPPRRGLYRRPLLDVRRATLRAAVAAEGLRPWDDPHNADPAFARSRVRHQALPALAQALGPGVAEALARTAAMLREDAEVLDGLAAVEAERIAGPDGWDVAQLAALPRALRRRVLRRAAIIAGAPAGSLSARHVAAVDEMVTRWHGQRWADLPGGVRAVRRYGKLTFTVGRPGERVWRWDAEDVVGSE